jgi:hypothetical protein
MKRSISQNDNRYNTEIEKASQDAELAARECPRCHYANYPQTDRCSNWECVRYFRRRGSVSFDELVQFQLPQLFHGRHWGKWVFDAERLCLVFRGEPVMRGGNEGGCPEYVAYLGHYELDLERFNRSSQVLDMVCQVNGKSWATARVVKDMMNALDDILHPQRFLCSGGGDKVIKKDNGAFLRDRIATVGNQKPIKDAA